MRQGDIVIATVRPTAGETKVRPAVVVTPDHLLTPGSTVRVAGVSTSYRPDDRTVVKLPWRPDGSVYTKLRRDSAACATLPDNAAFNDVRPTGGHVSKADLLRLVALMTAAGTL